jgi:CRISPR-associated protein Csm3
MELLGNVVLRGEIVCETGLHIGQEGTIEIGGIDNPVIKSPVSGYPYVPGSSLKGKMRALTEWDTGVVEDDGEPHTHDGPEAIDCPVCRVFGTPAETEAKTGPTRLVVRDAPPTDNTIEQWSNMDTQLPYTEVKTENSINRITSAVDVGLRDMERIPRDSTFQYELVYGVYDLGDGGETDLENLSTVQRAMVLLEDSALGGSGSRGYGKIRFQSAESEFEVRPTEAYGVDGAEGQPADSIEAVGEILGVT